MMSGMEELGFAIAGTTTAIGVLLQWQVPRRRMAMEEEVKDGALSPDEADRRLRFFAIAATIVTVIGVGMLIAVGWKFAQ